MGIAAIRPHLLAAEIVAGKSPVIPSDMAALVQAHINCAIHTKASVICSERSRVKRRLMLDRVPDSIREPVRARVLKIFAMR